MRTNTLYNTDTVLRIMIQATKAVVPHASTDLQLTKDESFTIHTGELDNAVARCSPQGAITLDTMRLHTMATQLPVPYEQALLVTFKWSIAHEMRHAWQYHTQSPVLPNQFSMHIGGYGYQQHEVDANAYASEYANGIMEADMIEILTLAQCIKGAYNPSKDVLRQQLLMAKYNYKELILGTAINVVAIYATSKLIKKMFNKKK